MFMFRKSTSNTSVEDVDIVEQNETVETVETNENDKLDDVTKSLESTNINKDDENVSARGSDDINENSDGESSEYESTDESEYDSTVNDESSNYVEDSEVYVITVDNIPKCYTYSLHTARTTMWKVARIMRNKDPLYNTIISEINLDHIEIVGHYNFAIVSVDKIMSSLRIHKIGRLLPIKKD